MRAAKKAGHRASATARRRARRRGGVETHWKALGNVVALVGVLVAMAVVFNHVNGRPDRMQAENNRLFDDMDRRIARASADRGQWIRVLYKTGRLPYRAFLNQPQILPSLNLAWDVIRVGNAIGIETRFSRGRPQGTWRLKENGARI